MASIRGSVRPVAAQSNSQMWICVWKGKSAHETDSIVDDPMIREGTMATLTHSFNRILGLDPTESYLVSHNPNAGHD